MRYIITGASEGLGLALARECLVRGIDVVGLSRSKPPVETTHIPVDLTDTTSIEKAIEEIKLQDGFDALINCAGVLSQTPLEALDMAETEALFRVNVLGPMQLVSGLIAEIKKHEADIVNVASTIGLKAYEEQLAYGSSKWALRGMSKNLQLELKQTKSRVISFCPGGFKSKIFEKATGKEMDFGKGWMEPDDLARLLLDLLALPKNMEVSEIVVNRK
jgi:3alpha(or 20beta)-hydroxysteroid dehydrogenase